MIDTKSLRDGDICLVSLEDENGYTVRNILCIFGGVGNGLFQNIEETHTNEVYGSSVYKFKKIQTAQHLTTILSDKLRSEPHE